MLLGEFLKEFQYEMECRNLSHRTIKVARNAFKLFINFSNKGLDVNELCIENNSK